MRRTLTIFALLALPACADEEPTSSPPEEVFAFDNARGATVAVALRTVDGATPEHAHVTIRAVPSTAASAPTPVPSTSATTTSATTTSVASASAVLWSGPVGAGGEARGVFTVPEPAPAVDIVVHAPGYRGRCPAERCAPHGAFAPAAWIRTTLDQVQHTVVELEEVGS